MGGFSWGEIIVVATVALVILGPRDLLVFFRNAGRFVGRMRGMAREFSTAMNQAADEAGVKDIQKSLKTATDPLGSAMDGVKDATKGLTDMNFEPGSETEKLSKERAEAARKIHAKSARDAAERKKREAEEAMKKAEELEAEVKTEET